MDGARSLKLSGNMGGRGQGTRAIIFLCVGQMLRLFICCVHQKDSGDVGESGDEAF